MPRQVPAKGAHDAKKDLFRGSTRQTDSAARARASSMALSGRLGSPRWDHVLPPASSFLFSGPVSHGTLSTILLESFKHPGPQLNPDRQVDEEIHFNIGSYCPVLPEPLGVKHRGEGQTNTALKRGYIYFLKLSPYDCLQLLPFLRF